MSVGFVGISFPSPTCRGGQWQGHDHIQSTGSNGSVTNRVFVVEIQRGAICPERELLNAGVGVSHAGRCQAQSGTASSFAPSERRKS